jgi:hypothetical protein
MILRIFRLTGPGLAALLCLGGCASQPPTIAHTHIGHAMTGWADTPGQKGLFVTAENAAQTALQAATRAAGQGNDLAAIKADIGAAIRATDPGTREGSDGKTVIQYGVKNALVGAENHIAFAAASRDASENVRNSSEIFKEHAQVVIDRCDLLLALGDEIIASSSPEEAGLLAGELLKLADANINGDDTDGDGVRGSAPEEYGLRQLRTELQAMLDREDPPYRTVDTWYLFNLIRLPSGEWIFRHFTSGGTTGGGSPY